MKSFSESERFCEFTFQNNGPYYFVSSSGKDTPILFKDRVDFEFAMNVIAQVIFKFNQLYIIAFAVMNNHFHFVVSCKDVILINMFFDALKRRLGRFHPEIKGTRLDIRPIKDLPSMRNHIVYCHRNGYVANPSYTPYSYPWGTGCFYFGYFTSQMTLSELKVDKKRSMFRGRDPKLPQEWNIINGYVSPTSFCKIEMGMAMFRNAHHYFYEISKNVESYSGIATEVDNEEYLTDNEAFALVMRIVRENYGVGGIGELGRAQVLDIARTMHFKYHSSNGQIRRMLRLSQYEVDSIFPLGK